MAGNFRFSNSSEVVVTDNMKQELAAECERQFENCRDTAVSFIVWLKVLRWTRIFFVVSPIIFGALATWKRCLRTPPSQRQYSRCWPRCCRLSFWPSTSRDTIKDYEKLAGEFMNLRDRFRQAKLIASQKPFPEFEAGKCRRSWHGWNIARSRVLAPPRWSFNKARKLIKSGVYTHDRDCARAPPGS